MTERKKSRKSKLVPRDLEFSSDEINNVQILEIPSAVSNVQTTEAPRINFNVEVEVEALNESDSSTEQGTMYSNNMTVKSKHIQMVLQNVTDITELRSTLEEFSKESLSVADNLLLVNFRNYLGKCLKNSNPTRIDDLIDDLFEKHKHSRLSKPETLNFYKCYMCNLAWWHLYDFREHLNQHVYSLVKLDVECMVKSRNIIAFLGLRPESKFIDIKSNCPKCGKTAIFHLTMVCKLCNSSFHTCTWFKMHERHCVKYKNNHMNSILATGPTDPDDMYKELNCKICSLPFFTVNSLQEHMIMGHSVRSDEPMNVDVKTCLFCRDKYVSLVHHPCSLKCENVRVIGCNRAFHNVAAAILHKEMAKKQWPCRVCGEILASECVEWLHIMMSHENNFKIVNRCLICPNINFLLDDYSLNIHFKVWHRSPKAIYYETIAVPTKMLTNEVLYDLESYKIAFRTSKKIESQLDATKECNQTNKRKRKPSQARPALNKRNENSISLISNRKKPLNNKIVETSIDSTSSDWSRNIEITIKNEINLDDRDDDNNSINTPTTEVNNKGVVQKISENKPETEDFELQIAVSHITKNAITNSESNSIEKPAIYIVNNSAGNELQSVRKPALNVLNNTNNTFINTSDTVKNTAIAVEIDLETAINTLDNVGNTADNIKNTVEVSARTVLNTADAVIKPANIMESIADTQLESEEEDFEDDIIILTNIKQEAEDEPIEIIDDSDIFLFSELEKTTNNKVYNSSMSNSTEIVAERLIAQTCLSKSTEILVSGPITQLSLSDSTEILADGPTTQVSLSNSTEILADKPIVVIDTQVSLSNSTEILADKPIVVIDDLENDVLEKSNISNEITEPSSSNFAVKSADENNLKQKNKLKTKSKKPKKYFCKSCNFGGYFAAYKQHKLMCRKYKKKKEKIISSTERYPCSKCNENFKTINKFLKHLRLHGFNKNLCLVCNSDVNNIQNINSHINNHVRGNYLRLLKIDGKGYKMHIPSKRKLFQCKKCKADVNESDLFAHWETHLHSVDRISVKIEREDVLLPKKLYNDGKTEPIVDKNVMKLVLKQLQDDERYGKGESVPNCVVCCRSFNRRSEIKIHLIEHLLVSAYSVADTFEGLRCEICFSVFKSQADYKQHMREHGSLTIYKCYICLKTFSDSSNFAKHKKVHDMLAFTCDICKGKFSQKKTLEKHLQMHMVRKPKQCERCLRVFHSETRFIRHKKIHEGKIKLRTECKICRITFTSLKSKWDHMWVQHKQRSCNADCPVCQESFRKYSDVKRHCIMVHNRTLPCKLRDFREDSNPVIQKKYSAPRERKRKQEKMNVRDTDISKSNVEQCPSTARTYKTSEALNDRNFLKSILAEHGIVGKNQPSLENIDESSVSNQSKSITVTIDSACKASDNSNVEETESKGITVRKNSASKVSYHSSVEEQHSSHRNYDWGHNIGVTIKQETVDENYEFTEIPIDLNNIISKQEAPKCNDSNTSTQTSLQEKLDLELQKAVSDMNKEVIDQIKVAKKTAQSEEPPETNEENIKHRIKFEIKDEPIDMNGSEVFVFSDFADIIENSSGTSFTIATDIYGDLNQEMLLPETLTSGGPRLYFCMACNFRGKSADFREHKQNYCINPVSKKLGKGGVLGAATVFPCSKCHVIFNTINEYLSHLSRHGINTKLCPICDKSIAEIKCYASHIKTHIELSFLKLYKIADGMEISETHKKNYHCKTCKAHVQLNEIFQHWESHLHNLNANSTRVEPKEVLLPQKLYNDGRTEPIIDKKMLKMVIDELHLESRKEKRFATNQLNNKKCLVCGRKFARPSEKKRHLIEHLLVTAYSVADDFEGLRCEICFTIFSNEDQYKHHMREHASLTIYKCNLCLRSFSDSSNFAKHKKVHNMSVYVCDLCSKKFTHKNSLEKHMEMHTSTKPIMCDLCDRIFYSETRFARHKKWHLDGKPSRFECKICRIFFFSTKLKLDHMWEVHKQRKYNSDCPYCQIPFRKWSEVTAHCRIVHTEEFYNK